jgi:hypothetical protein
MRECIREGVAPFVNAGWGNRVHVNVVGDKELVQHLFNGGGRFLRGLKAVELEPFNQLHVLPSGWGPDHWGDGNLVLSVDRINKGFVLLRFANTGEIRIRGESNLIFVRYQILVGQVRKTTTRIRNGVPGVSTEHSQSVVLDRKSLQRPNHSRMREM